MKKTLIALSVLVAAGSVNAATVYDKDGFSLSVYGDSEVKYTKAKTDGSEAKWAIGDADFGFKSSSAINEEMSVFTTIEFDGEEQADLDSDGSDDQYAVELDDLYVGFTAGATTVQVGKQVNLVDDIGISNDTTFGLDTAEDALSLASSGDQVMKVTYAADTFTAAFSTTSMSDGSDTTDEGSQIALMLGGDFGDASVKVFYADGDAAAVDNDADVLALKASYAINDVTLTGIYTTGSDDAGDVDAIGANILYSMDKYSFNFGAVNLDADSAADAVVSWYANAKYAVATGATAYVEIANTDEDNAEMGYSVGMAYSF